MTRTPIASSTLIAVSERLSQGWAGSGSEDGDSNCGFDDGAGYGTGDVYGWGDRAGWGFDHNSRLSNTAILWSQLPAVFRIP